MSTNESPIGPPTPTIPFDAGYTSLPQPEGLIGIAMNKDMDRIGEAVVVTPEGIEPRDWATEADATLARFFKAQPNPAIVEILTSYLDNYALAVERYARRGMAGEIAAMGVVVLDDDATDLERAVRVRNEIALRLGMRL